MARKLVTPIMSSLLVHAAAAASLTLLVSRGNSRLPEVGPRSGEELTVEVVETAPPTVEAPPVAETARNEMPRPVQRPTASPADGVPSPSSSASPTSQVGTEAWSFSPTVPSTMNIDLGAARNGVVLGEAAPKPAETTHPVPAPAVQEQLATNDAELGLGPAGPVVAALRRATVQNVRSEGAAVLRIVFDGAGRIVAIRVLHSTGPTAAWVRVIEAAMHDANASPSLAGATADVRVDFTVEHGKVGQTHPVEVHGEQWAMASSEDLWDVRRVALRVLHIARGEPAR